MLNSVQVCDICRHLLLVKSSTLILCKAIDIDYFVKTLLEQNEDLIFDKNSRILRNRKNNARIRFVTSVSFTDLKSISPDNCFYVEDVDEKLLKAASIFKNVFCFRPLEF